MRKGRLHDFAAFIQKVASGQNANGSRLRGGFADEAFGQGLVVVFPCLFRGGQSRCLLPERGRHLGSKVGLKIQLLPCASCFRLLFECGRRELGGFFVSLGRFGVFCQFGKRGACSGRRELLCLPCLLRLLQLGGDRVELLFRGREDAVEAAHFSLFRLGDYKHSVLAPPNDRLLDVRKKCPKGIEVLGGERIELVVVTLGAARRLPQPGRANGAHPVREHSCLVVLGLCTSFFGGEHQPVERGTDPRLAVGIGKQIPGDLFERKAVKTLVVVERFDDPVAVGPHIARVVAVVADCVCKPHHVQPSKGHALTVVRVVEQLGNELLVGLGLLVCDKGGNLCRGGGKP